jgi:hypothetical protein
VVGDRAEVNGPSDEVFFSNSRDCRFVESSGLTGAANWRLPGHGRQLADVDASCSDARAAVLEEQIIVAGGKQVKAARRATTHQRDRAS